MYLEFPSGPVPLYSHLYVERSPLEQLAFAEVTKPGGLVRIRSPKNTGKSSLLVRIMSHAKLLNYQTVCVDLQQADESVFSNIDRFLRWFCANVSRQLKRELLLEDYWDEEIGCKVSCTLYFQGYLLPDIDQALVIAINEMQRLFEYPQIAQEFLPLLRSWHEESKQNEVLQKLRLIIVHDTEVYIPLQITQSPFNVGLAIKLPEFNLEQVQQLAESHGLEWFDQKATELLMGKVGGHPYLVRLALYHLVHRCQDKSIRTRLKGLRELEALLQDASRVNGIYSDHLRSHLIMLQDYPHLAIALYQIVTAAESIPVEAVTAYQLESMGLVRLEGDCCSPSCALYRFYFANQLAQYEETYQRRYERLEQQNRELQRLCHLDELTQVANRRYFDYQLAELWRQLALERSPLTVIFCDIDFFKVFNDTFGHLAGDACLRQVAHTLRGCLKGLNDLVARYGGEEFAILVPQADPDQAIRIAEEIRSSIQALGIQHNSTRIAGLPSSFLTVSMGIASVIPEMSTSPETLLHAADQALYTSKRNGRDRITLYPSAALHHH